MARLVVLLLVALVGAVLCKPVEHEIKVNLTPGHSLWKRFIDPSLTDGGFADSGVSKMRTKRDAEDCEKLQLCRLHARSRRNFISAFELYFVNKENARLWDHHARSLAECNRKFSCHDEYDR